MYRIFFKITRSLTTFASAHAIAGHRTCLKDRIFENRRSADARNVKGNQASVNRAIDISATATHVEPVTTAILPESDIFLNSSGG